MGGTCLQRLRVVHAAPGVADYVRVLGHAELEAADGVADPAIPARVHEAAGDDAGDLRAACKHTALDTAILTLMQMFVT